MSVASGWAPVLRWGSGTALLGLVGRLRGPPRYLSGDRRRLSGGPVSVAACWRRDGSVSRAGSGVRTLEHVLLEKHRMKAQVRVRPAVVAFRAEGPFSSD